MDVTVEKLVWVILAIITASMVGVFLMGRLIPQTQQVGQSMYVRLIKSTYMGELPTSGSGYVITLRIVNGGEGGRNITSLAFQPVGFGASSGNSHVYLPDGTEITSGYNLTTPVPPKGTVDVTILVPSPYVSTGKSLVVTATFDDGTTSAISVMIP